MRVKILIVGLVAAFAIAATSASAQHPRTFKLKPTPGPTAYAGSVQ